MFAEEKKIAEKACVEAGSILREKFGKAKARVKGLRDIVTEADYASEQEIIRIIKNAFPEHGVYSEEAGSATDAEFLWVVDPLDGTNNYAYGIPLYGVSIALAVKGEVKLGAIYYPETSGMLCAEKGKGATLDGKEISVTKREKLEDSVILMDTKLWKMPREGAEAVELSGKIFGMRMLGAAVYNFGFVALGKADACVEMNLKNVDFAAGALIVEEAGGKVTGLRGEKWSLDTTSLIASNGKIHAKIIEELKATK
ncbi:inositol monophosphatase [Candidatus Micrarchaeota archaeon]|nr:inositol monophosphatase [Candidatus Micrarchaeota archaeon]